MAKKMNEVDGSNKFSSSQCNKKWSNLELTYKIKRDKKTKMGEHGGRKWLYYDLMEEIIGSTAAALSVISCSRTEGHRYAVTDGDEEPAQKSQHASSHKSATKGTQRGEPPKWFKQFLSRKTPTEGMKKHWNN